MKKLFLLVLVIVMFACSVAQADPAYLGAWTAVLESGEITVFRLLPDHSVYYLFQAFPAGTPVSGIFTWEEVDDQTFSIINGQGDPVGVYSMLNKNRILDRNDIIYANTLISVPMNQISFSSTPEPQPTETPEPAGITVPSGIYTAGDDFPAGTYRIELADPDNSGVVLLYESISDVNTAFAYLYEYSLNNRSGSPVVGKIEIKDGNTLAVRNTVVILLPYEGLK